MCKDLPTLNKIHQYLSYDPDTGHFYRKRNGKRADTPMNTGYRRVRITIDGFNYEFLAHRLAKFMVDKEWPSSEIDHINGTRDDNRIINLRHVDRKENAKNARRRSNNTSGFSGVIKHNKGWKIRVSRKYIGYTGCFGKAIQIRKQAEKEFGYHINHGRP